MYGWWLFFFFGSRSSSGFGGTFIPFAPTVFRTFPFGAFSYPFWSPVPFPRTPFHFFPGVPRLFFPVDAFDEALFPFDIFAFLKSMFCYFRPKDMKPFERSSANITEILAKGNRFLLLGHRKFDGDSYGCVTAFSQYLDLIGKTYRIVNDEEVPSEYHFLGKHGNVDRELPSDDSGFDAVFVFDTANTDLIGAPYLRKDLFDRLPVVNIDHHPNSGFGTVHILDCTASCACAIVYRLFVSLGATITPDMATALYLGVLYDTNSFKNTNTNAETFEFASVLAGSGARIQEVVDAFFRSISPEKLRFWGVILARMELNEAKNVAWVCVPDSLYAEIGVDREEAGSLKILLENFIACMTGIDIAYVLKEDTDGAILASFRGRTDRYDCSKLTDRLFSGGGHKR